MVLLVVVSFFSLIGLLVLHELGHFMIAKKFGVKVEEFGIGYPPRLFAKKIGSTVYSLNLLPFGAFVAMPGEIGKREEAGSFSGAKLSHRILIALGGVLSFWVLASIIFSIVMFVGAPTAVGDDSVYDNNNPQVQIASVSADSPAQKAGLRAGDIVLKIQTQDSANSVQIDKTKQLQDFISQNQGKSVVLTIQRGKEIFDVNLMPRVNPPAGEGSMGVGLIRIIIMKYSFYEAPLRGVEATGNVTISAVMGWAAAIAKVSHGTPSGVQLVGPIGIVNLFTQMGELGFIYFFQFVGIVSVYLALGNLLPIPAADGGKFIFLLLEGIRKKPVPEIIEQRITSVCFFLLVLLLVWVSIKDIIRIF